jgi:mannose-6-phosphate isomerase-like protein (cupin superfamily)
MPRREPPPDSERSEAREGYRPSPRPTFDQPTLITSERATRHIWGDQTAGEVADWIYVSSGLIHALVFVLAPGGSFRHSLEHRTVFGADELLYVLDGAMAIANPETGEVERAGAGESVFFRRNTWHHVFARGSESLRVLELFAPPPATGSSGAYARTRPYLEESRYADDSQLGAILPGRDRDRSLNRVRIEDVVWRFDLGVLSGIYASTEHLTAGVIEIDPGETSTVHAHGGDEVLYVIEGTIDVRAWSATDVHVFEVGPHDACYLPAGCEHEYRNLGGSTARAVVGVAPRYDV